MDGMRNGVDSDHLLVDFGMKEEAAAAVALLGYGYDWNGIQNEHLDQNSVHTVEGSVGHFETRAVVQSDPSVDVAPVVDAHFDIPAVESGSRVVAVAVHFETRVPAVVQSGSRAAVVAAAAAVANDDEHHHPDVHHHDPLLAAAAASQKNDYANSSST